MRHRITALTGAVIAGAVINTVIGATPAMADERGFSVRVSAPADFTVGNAAQTVEAVVTSENRRCRKVRWVLLMRSQIDADQLRVTRIEENGEFATSRSTDGNITTIIDNDLDPGESCRGRTVTGRWQVAFRGPEDGGVQFEVRAFDAANTLLTAGGANATVGGGTEPAPTEEAPSPEETEEPEAPEETEETEEPAPVEEETTIAADDDSSDEAGAALVADETSLLGPGLIIGGICVFLGVMLLLRLRMRGRQTQLEAQAAPTGFYSVSRPSR